MGDTVEAVFYNACWLTDTDGEDRRGSVILYDISLLSSERQIIDLNGGSHVYHEQ